MLANLISIFILLMVSVAVIKASLISVAMNEYLYQKQQANMQFGNLSERLMTNPELRTVELASWVDQTKALLPASEVLTDCDSAHHCHMSICWRGLKRGCVKADF